MYTKAPIEKCPHCGANEGYYIKQQVRGSIIYNINFDGEPGDNSEMHSGLSYRGGKVAYCIECDKKLFNMSETLKNLFTN